ncbi:O-antigen ligase family protein [Photobacterium leiognathi]|uniref:O-antigen ligase family protein n=1 Tax=Photobacterium leiognathi TaxID=553611 RepID=UPI002982335C|nr:O-antigen ligase family protein [Photobacterium leiognathi]
MRKISLILSLLLMYVIFFFDSYVFELSQEYFSNGFLLNVIRGAAVLFFLLSLPKVRLNILASFFIIYIFMYILSSYYFTQNIETSNYYFYNFIFGVLLFCVLSEAINRIGYYYIIRLFLIMSIIFTIISLLIEFIPISRYITDYNKGLFICGQSWNIRKCGATNNPNALGMIGFVIFIYLIHYGDRYKDKFYYLACSCILIIALLSLSRSFILAVIIYMLIITMFSSISSKLKLFLLSIVLFFLVLYLNPDVLDRFTLNSLSSGSGRSTIFKSAFEYIASSPVFGNGLNFNRDYNLNGISWVGLIDNAYLNVFVSYGVVGLMLFLSLFGALYLKIKTHINKVVILSSIMFVFFVEDFFIKTYFMWMVLPLLLNDDGNNKYDS